MSGIYYITPTKKINENGPSWIVWLEKYVQGHASTPEAISVRDFLPEVVDKIEEEGANTETQANMQMVLAMMGRLACENGLARVPITIEDVQQMTKALVMDKALHVLHNDRIIGEYCMAPGDVPGPEAGSPLGVALKLWLASLKKNK